MENLVKMESKEDVKLEQETVMQNSFTVASNLNGPENNQDPKMSNIQAKIKRRFMITDILNSAVESAKEQKGLDMRLLFPGVTRLQMSQASEHFPKLQSEQHSPDLDGDSDNDGDDDHDEEDKGKSYLYSPKVSKGRNFPSDLNMSFSDDKLSCYSNT